MRDAASKSCRRQLKRQIKHWRKEEHPHRRDQIHELRENSERAIFTAPVLKSRFPPSRAPISNAPGLSRNNSPQEIFPCLRSWRPVVALWTDRSFHPQGEMSK